MQKSINTRFVINDVCSSRREHQSKSKWDHSFDCGEVLICLQASLRTDVVSRTCSVEASRSDLLRRSITPLARLSRHSSSLPSSVNAAVKGMLHARANDFSLLVRPFCTLFHSRLARIFSSIVLINLVKVLIVET